MRICIGADIVPTENNINLFVNGEANELIGDELMSHLHNADFIALNLEVPLVDIESPIRKCGPHLVAPSACIKAIKQINPYFFTLANNHIMDQGANGVANTCKVLRENGIEYCGVGDTLSKVKRDYIKNINELKVGFYCCAEHEFSIATETMPGANPYDPLESFDYVERMRQECDYLVVLYHGGKEYYRYPSPYLQRVFRKFADKGANLVIAQHTHCIGCKEEYNGSTFIYGQGNFLFNKMDNEFCNSSLLVNVEFDSERKADISYLPIVKTECGIKIASECEATEILRLFYERSEEIKSHDFIIENYEKLIMKKLPEYLVALGGNRFTERILRKVFGNNVIYRLRKNGSTRLLNFVECESHLEIIVRGIKTLI